MGREEGERGGEHGITGKATPILTAFFSFSMTRADASSLSLSKVGRGEVNVASQSWETHTNGLLHLLGHLFGLLFHLVDDGIPNLCILPGTDYKNGRIVMSRTALVSTLTLYQRLAMPSSTRCIPRHSALRLRVHPNVPREEWSLISMPCPRPASSRAYELPGDTSP